MYPPPVIRATNEADAGGRGERRGEDARPTRHSHQHGVHLCEGAEPNRGRLV
jgi:hypothetical protein